MVVKPRDPGYYEGDNNTQAQDESQSGINSVWISTSANHNRAFSYETNQNNNTMKDMKVNFSLTQRNPITVRHPKTPVENITGSGRRGHTLKTEFVNRNLLSQVPQILAWQVDKVDDEIE
jgi:hypothetical protein